MGCVQSNIVQCYIYPYVRLDHLTIMEKKIMEVMMPIYYNNKTTELSNDDITQLHNCWIIIINTKCVYNDNISSSLVKFYDNFYDRMFLINSTCETLFNDGLKIKIYFLTSMMSLVFKLFKNKSQFKKLLLNIAISHNNMGIEIIDYILLLDTLCWTFSVVLGPLIFTENIHNILIQMFHEIFDTLFPLIILHKIKLSNVKLSSAKKSCSRYKSSHSSGSQSGSDSQSHSSCPYLAGSQSHSSKSHSSKSSDCLQIYDFDEDNM